MLIFSILVFSFVDLQVEAENTIKSLVSSALGAMNVKAGLKWPPGEESICERFSSLRFLCKI